MKTAGPVVAFEPLKQQTEALARSNEVQVRAGHVDLGPDLWLSCDPAGGAQMVCRPEGEGFRLEISGAESGQWACLGMKLSSRVLEKGRYMGLLIDAAPEALVAFSPSLRYYLQSGAMEDVATPMPVVLPAGPNRQLSYIEIDPALVARSESCELNLFFQGDGLNMKINRLEPLLIS